MLLKLLTFGVTLGLGALDPEFILYPTRLPVGSWWRGLALASRAPCGRGGGNPGADPGAASPGLPPAACPWVCPCLRGAHSLSDCVEVS